jgi:hypothetical protein
MGTLIEILKDLLMALGALAVLREVLAVVGYLLFGEDWKKNPKQAKEVSDG